MLGSIVTVLAPAKYPTNRSGVVALAIFFYAVGFPALAALSHLFYFYAKAKPFMSLYFLLPLDLIFESSRIPGQCRNYRFLVLLNILMAIPAIIAFAILIAVKLFLETFAIQF